MQRTLWPIVTRLLAEGPDEVLLDRYFRHQDQEAFAQLLMRYNRLVWGQCRNLLVNDADAEDAFQATFLTLARSAKRLKAGSPLGPWLHGVAFRVCMNARRVIGRRAKREKASAQPDAQQPVADSSWEKAFAAVAEEVQRLPETQRVAFVLCYLEGRPVVEAAASLGQKLGTFTSRLSRAKQALLDRLAKRGLGVGVLALSGVTGSAVVAPAAVVERSLALLPSGVAIPGSVQVLTQGVTGMSLIPFKLLAASMMLVTGLGTGASILTHRTLAAGPHEANRVPISQLEAKAPVPKAKPKEDEEILRGTWHIVEVEVGGPLQPKETSKDQTLAFTRDKLVINYDDGSSQEMTYQLDPKQKPRAIDLSPTDEREKGYTFKGIYELDGDRLKLYYSRNVAPDAERPARFDPDSEDRGMRFYVLKRVPRKAEVGDAKKQIDPKILAKLAIQLHSKAWEEKSAAVMAVAKLLAATKDDDTDFGLIVEPLFVNAGWGGEAADNARSAEDSLVRIGRQATPYLRERLKVADAHDRRVAAELLVRIGPANAALEVLLRSLLTDPDHYVRKAAIDGLATLVPGSKEAVADLERVATNDPNLARRVGARIALIRVSGVSEERVRALAAFLELKDEGNQDGKEAAVYAASALGDMGPKAKAAEAQLLVALKNPDLRSVAAHTLGQIGANSPEAITALMDVLKNAPEQEARRSAAGSLGAFGPAAKAAIPALSAALNGDAKGGWWVAADALGKIGGADVVPILTEALTNPDGDIRVTSMRALAGC